MAHTRGSDARAHGPGSSSDIAVDHPAGGTTSTTTRTALIAAAILVGLLLLGARGRGRPRAYPHPVKPARPIAVPPRPG
jgi:hypothetical protein